MKNILLIFSPHTFQVAANLRDVEIATAANIDRVRPKPVRPGAFFGPLIIAGLLLLLPNTASAITRTSNVSPSGSWNTAASWTPNGVPANGDDVIIAAGDTIIVNTSTTNIASLTISGTLTVGNNNTDRTVTVTGNLTVNSGGIFNTAGDGGNILNVGGNLTNNGTFDANIGAAILAVTFNGAANQTVSGTGATTDLNAVTVNNTGAANSNIVEISSSNFTAPAAFLTLTDGILKMSGAYTFTNVFFTPAAYTINADEGIWINNANVTVTAQAGDATISGLLRVSQGTYNIGTAGNEDLIYNTGSTIDVQGGSLNVAGGIHGSATTSTTTYSQSGGTVTVVTQGSTGATFGSFDIRAAGSSFTMSGGMILLQEATQTAADYRVGASTNNVTGGTLQIGSNTTPALPTTLFLTNSSTPVFNLTITSTINPILRVDAALTIKGNLNAQTGSTLNANNFNISIAGNWTKNGSFTPGTATVTFNGSSVQNMSGTATTFNNLTINNTSGVAAGAVTLSTDATVSATLTLTTGNVATGANTLIVSGTATGAISGGGSASYVIGNLRRSIGLGVYLFPVGDDGYSPFTNDVTAISGSHTFTASAANAFMTGVTDTSKAIQRTWTLSTTAASNQITSTLTFQYVTGTPPGGDVPATVNTSTLDALRRNGNGTINQIAAFSRTANSVIVANINAFSDWTLGNGGAAPTAVDCISFNAYSDEKGSVFIQWQTGYEVDNLGFNIYRDQGGKRSRVNPSLVAGSALLAGARTVLTAGGSYAWFDSQANSGEFVQYWLEDVDLNGKTTLHGPVSPVSSGKLPPQAESILLSRLRSVSPEGATQAQQQLSISKERSNATGKANAPDLLLSASSLQAQWEVAARAAVKIVIRREGWHRVTQPQLVAAGLNPAANPRTLQLFVDGQELPIIVTGEDKTQLEPSDYIEFFATPLDTPSTDLHTYFLVADSHTGRRIKLSQGGNGAPADAKSFPFTIERKDRLIYFAALKNGDADNFFGPIVSSDPVTQSLVVRHLDGQAKNNASLIITLQGATDSPSSNPDHNVCVLFNGSNIGTVSFDGQSRKTAMFSISNNLLREGDNSVTLTALGEELDLSLIDSMRLTYQHTYAADDDALRFAAQGRESVKVAGFTSPQIRVVDVTDPNDVQELKAAVEPLASGFAVRVAPQDAGQRTLLAFAASQINQPAGAVVNQPSSWNRAGQLADMIIISHRSLIDSARPLQTLRQRQNLKVALVDVEDLYDEFSYGARSPQAIKDFLARALSNFKNAPRFVLLMGDASFDPRNYLGFGDSDFVPTKLIETDLLETASDDWFVDFNSDSLPEMAIGRLPARTAAEAATMVRKIISYDAAPVSESLLLVADRNDLFDFESADNQLRALIPGNLRVEEIRRASTDDVTAKNLLIEKINEGQKIVNYSGHGSVEIWRGSLLTSADAAQLTNSDRLSLFVTMTCLNAYFHDVGTNSLAEALMKAENGGAVAVWASSSLTEPAGQSLMNQQLYRLLFGGGQAMTIGEATAKAKAAVGNRDIRRSWVLFGDPAARLK
jgi:hypothetical protein